MEDTKQQPDNFACDGRDTAAVPPNTRERGLGAPATDLISPTAGELFGMSPAEDVCVGGCESPDPTLQAHRSSHILCGPLVVVEHVCAADAQAL